MLNWQYSRCRREDRQKEIESEQVHTLFRSLSKVKKTFGKMEYPAGS